MSSIAPIESRCRKAFLTIKNLNYPLYTGINTVGRDRKATVILKETEISHQQAVIVILENKHYISDSQSSNGTFLNGEKLQPFVLYAVENKSAVTFGTLEATYNVLAASEEITDAVRNTQQTQNDDLYAADTQTCDPIERRQQRNDEIIYSNYLVEDEANFNQMTIQFLSTTEESQGRKSLVSIHDMETQPFDPDLLAISNAATQLLPLDDLSSSAAFSTEEEPPGNRSFEPRTAANEENVPVHDADGLHSEDSPLIRLPNILESQCDSENESQLFVTKRTPSRRIGSPTSQIEDTQSRRNASPLNSTFESETETRNENSTKHHAANSDSDSDTDLDQPIRSNRKKLQVFGSDSDTDIDETILDSKVGLDVEVSATEEDRNTSDIIPPTQEKKDEDDDFVFDFTSHHKNVAAPPATSAFPSQLSTEESFRLRLTDGDESSVRLNLTEESEQPGVETIIDSEDVENQDKKKKENNDKIKEEKQQTQESLSEMEENKSGALDALGENRAPTSHLDIDSSPNLIIITQEDPSERTFTENISQQIEIGEVEITIGNTEAFSQSTQKIDLEHCFADNPWKSDASDGATEKNDELLGIAQKSNDQDQKVCEKADKVTGIDEKTVDEYVFVVPTQEIITSHANKKTEKANSVNSNEDVNEDVFLVTTQCIQSEKKSANPEHDYISLEKIGNKNNVMNVQTTAEDKEQCIEDVFLIPTQSIVIEKNSEEPGDDCIPLETVKNINEDMNVASSSNDNEDVFLIPTQCIQLEKKSEEPDNYSPLEKVEDKNEDINVESSLKEKEQCNEDILLIPTKSIHLEKKSEESGDYIRLEKVEDKNEDVGIESSSKDKELSDEDVFLIPTKSIQLEKKSEETDNYIPLETVENENRNVNIETSLKDNEDVFLIPTKSIHLEKKSEESGDSIALEKVEDKNEDVNLETSEKDKEQSNEDVFLIPTKSMQLEKHSEEPEHDYIPLEKVEDKNEDLHLEISAKDKEQSNEHVSVIPQIENNAQESVISDEELTDTEIECAIQKPQVTVESQLEVLFATQTLHCHTIGTEDNRPSNPLAVSFNCEENSPSLSQILCSQQINENTTDDKSNEEHTLRTSEEKFKISNEENNEQKTRKNKLPKANSSRNETGSEAEDFSRSHKNSQQNKTIGMLDQDEVLENNRSSVPPKQRLKKVNAAKKGKTDSQSSHKDEGVEAKRKPTRKFSQKVDIDSENNSRNERIREITGNPPVIIMENIQNVKPVQIASSSKKSARNIKTKDIESEATKDSSDKKLTIKEKQQQLPEKGEDTDKDEDFIKTKRRKTVSNKVTIPEITKKSTSKSRTITSTVNQSSDAEVVHTSNKETESIPSASTSGRSSSSKTPTTTGKGTKRKTKENRLEEENAVEVEAGTPTEKATNKTRGKGRPKKGENSISASVVPKKSKNSSLQSRNCPPSLTTNTSNVLLSSGDEDDEEVAHTSNRRTKSSIAAPSAGCSSSSKIAENRQSTTIVARTSRGKRKTKEMTDDDDVIEVEVRTAPNKTRGRTRKRENSSAESNCVSLAKRGRNSSLETSNGSPNLSTTSTRTRNNCSLSSTTSTPHLERSRREQKPKVVFTMLDSPELESAVRSLGGQVVDNVDSATVLVTASVKRTMKFLTAVGQGKPICSSKWLTESKKLGRFLDPWDYILKDKEMETKWNFTLQESLNRSGSQKLLEEYTFVLLVNAALDVLKGAIEACGGRCLTKAPTNTNLVVISTADNRSKYTKYLKQKVKVVLPEAIFDGVLRQELRLDQHLLT